MYRKHYVPPRPSLELTILNDMDNIVRVMTHEVARKRSVKFCMVATVEYVKEENGEVIAEVTHFLRSPSYILTQYQDHGELFMRGFRHVQTSMEDFLENGSGFTLNAVFRCDLEFGQCLPLNGRCGDRCSVKTTRDLRLLRMVSSPPVDDGGGDGGSSDCFFTAIAHHFTRSEDPARNRHWIRHHLETVGVRTPVDIRSIRKFESLNRRLNLRISVIAEEAGDFYPLRVSPSLTFARESTRGEEEEEEEEGEEARDVSDPDPTSDAAAAGVEGNHVVLLLMRTGGTAGGGGGGGGGGGEVCEAINHYVHVADIGKLLRKSYARSGGGSSYHYSLYCTHCLNRFSLESALEKHRALCMQNKTQRLVLPEEGSSMQFTHFCKKFEVPLVGFYDFECCMVDPPSPCVSCSSEEAVGCRHKTLVLAEQRAMTYSILMVDYLGNVVYHNTRSGDEDCAGLFLGELLDMETSLMHMLKEKRPMKLSRAEQEGFENAIACHICGDPFGEEKPVKCRDHCHLTGERPFFFQFPNLTLTLT